MELELVQFIQQHDDWENLLQQKPYCLTISRDNLFGRNLVMFKYSQIDSDFSQEIVKESRGLILEEGSWEVVSYPFRKFMNYGEPTADQIDWSTAQISQKVDGCVSKDTKIKTTEGDIDIQEICRNPSKYHLLTFNHLSNQIEEDSVQEISIQDSLNNWYQLELEDGRILTVTGNHQIWCENLQCYRRVDELNGSEELKIL